MARSASFVGSSLLLPFQNALLVSTSLQDQHCFAAITDCTRLSAVINGIFSWSEHSLLAFPFVVDGNDQADVCNVAWSVREVT